MPLGIPFVETIHIGRTHSRQENLKGRILRHSQGKALGGSSALNAEILVAPSNAEIDAWEKIGNPGWDWESMAPHYRKIHTLNLPSKYNREHLGIDWSDEKVRGTSGTIQASFPVGKEDRDVQEYGQYNPM